MEVEVRATAEVVDFAAYRARRQQRTLFDEQSPLSEVQDWTLRPHALSLSERQLAHRRRMLAFLLTPR